MARQRGCHVIVIAVLLFSLGAAAAEADVAWKIDERAAQRLAAEAWDRGKTPAWFDYSPGVDPPFFVFYGLNRLDGGFGFFAVNPWTGNVWDLWACHVLSTPALRKSQAAIRRRFTREESKEYRRLAWISTDDDPANVGFVQPGMFAWG